MAAIATIAVTTATAAIGNAAMATKAAVATMGKWQPLQQ